MPGGFFHFDLKSTAKNQTHLDVHLKQLALEIISSIPKYAVQVYTDCSGTETHTGSGLDAILSYDINFGEFWILSDSRSALQQLSNWSSAVDETSICILLKLKKISQNHDAHLQWIPSHVNVSGNELADSLAKKSSEDETATGSSLTYQELYSNERSKLNLSWRTPAVHHWYTGTAPGILLEVKYDRNSQTALARLKSGHLK
ncbi:uncharacterized protein TNCV_4049211 [Trichonephila clavipes]|nr:uncharacterized protein TNCV_4049211 [Trichonephila clavipes]